MTFRGEDCFSRAEARRTAGLGTRCVLRGQGGDARCARGKHLLRIVALVLFCVPASWERHWFFFFSRAEAQRRGERHFEERVAF
jgi:hypothetical protein